MRVLTGLAAMAALAFAPVAARAAAITYTSQFFPAAAGQTPQYSPTNWDGTTQSLALPRFNPALGTLTGISLSLLGGIQSSGSLNNTGDVTATINDASATMDISILAPGTPTPSDGSSGALITVGPTLFHVGSTDLAPGGSIAFGPVTDNANNTTPITTAFAPYVGSGNVLFPLVAVADSNFDYDGGNLQLSQSTGARAQAAITYTYNAAAAPVSVPEPATPAMLGAGLLCLGLLSRRG